MRTQAQATTILARIIGPVMAIMGLALVARPATFVGIVDAFAADAMAPLLWGFLALVMGLTVLAFHQCWDGAVAIVITVIGWLMVVRGVVLLFVPEEVVALAQAIVAAAPPGLMAAGAVMALIGAWLSFAGFRARPVASS